MRMSPLQFADVEVLMLLAHQDTRKNNGGKNWKELCGSDRMRHVKRVLPDTKNHFITTHVLKYQ